jgi:hypothetical protein
MINHSIISNNLINDQLLNAAKIHKFINFDLKFSNYMPKKLGMFFVVIEVYLSLLSTAKNYFRYINAIATGSKRWHQSHWSLAIQFLLVP